MFNTMLAVTILTVLGGVALLAIFLMPWWLTVTVFAAVIWLLDKLFNPVTGNGDGEAV